MKHEWVMLATFSVEDEVVGEMAKARLTVMPSVDSEPLQVPVNLSQEGLLTVDGPGCGKCQVLWSAGWGLECPGE